MKQYGVVTSHGILPTEPNHGSVAQIIYLLPIK